MYKPYKKKPQITDKQSSLRGAYPVNPIPLISMIWFWKTFNSFKPQIKSLSEWKPWFQISCVILKVLGAANALPEIYTELEISYFLLRRLLGVRTEGDKKAAKVSC